MVLHTLQVEHAFLLLVYTLLTLVNARLQKGMRGVQMFVLYNGLALVGAVAVVLRGDIPDFLSIVVGNLCVVGGYTALYSSMHQVFSFSRRQHVLAGLWMALGVVTMFWFGQVQPATGPRLFLFSVVLALQQFQLAALLLLGSGRKRTLAWMPGALLVFLGLANTARMAIVVEQGVPRDYRAAGSALAFIVLANACLQCGLMVSYVWMTAAQLRHDLEVQATTDPLTGLLNRRAIQTAAERESGARIKGAFPAVILLDLDRYKPINDQLGHAAGDQALVAVARFLQRQLRPGDLAARTGGDEFTLLLPRTSAVDALAIAETLREVLQELDLGLGEARVTATFGVAQAEPGESWDAVCSRCDRALYAGKAEGGNCVHADRPALSRMLEEISQHFDETLA